MTADPSRASHAASEPSDLAVLAAGELQVEARVLPASNVTLVGTAASAGRSLRCVYKPVAGERPLWDFPDGTLAAREVAAYTVSEALGWDVVPPTVLRDGPAGPGMAQLWCEPDPDLRPVDVVPHGQVPAGYRHVLDAQDEAGRPVTLVHEDNPALRRMAVFDALVNNADRKGGHVLPMTDGRRLGVDHGVCFHVDPKLRTVLWGWATLPLHDDELDTLAAFRLALADASTALRRTLAELIDDHELAALDDRCAALLEHRRMPLPGGDWPAVPWPAL
jgi:uncharacterized repeat protein (TIGR03843 family)